LRQDLQYLTRRSWLPIVIAGVFGVIVVIVLAIFVLGHGGPKGPSPEELAADYAKGQQYEHGTGVTTDYVQALDWYHKAADLGYAPAEFAVGVMTRAGRGIDMDEKGALVWFRRAADHGSAEAQVLLAADTLSGRATQDGKPDKIEALKWLLLGADGVSDPLMKQVAAHTQQELANQLSEDEQAEAARRADDWRKQHGIGG